MQCYILITKWSEWGSPGKSHIEFSKPFPATDDMAALSHVQTQHPFIRGSLWHFAGKMYQLHALQPVTAGETLILKASDYD